MAQSLNTMRQAFLVYTKEIYDDYRDLERELNLIHFAYDRLKIRL